MRRSLLIGGACTVALGVGLSLLLLRGQPAPAAADVAVPIGSARVVRTDIVSSQRVNATLDYGGATTVLVPGGTSPDQVQQARATVASAQAAVDAAQTAAADTAAANQLAIAQAQGAAALAAAQQHAEQAQHQADAQLRSARVTLQNAQAALALATSSARLDGVFTALPALGATVTQGQQLYAVGGHPVVLLYGPQPAWRELGPGCSGDDVRQLESDLLALGASGLVADGSFTDADAGAIRRWQAALGVTQTGTVRLGEVVFTPGPARVAAVRTGLGAQAQPGSPVLDLTSIQHTVTAQLDAGRQQLVRPGDRVSVLMPDGRTTVAGTVTDVSRVATMPSASQGQGGGGQFQTPTIAVTVTLADQAAAGALDQAPVYVSITTASRRGVLAVPVTALLAQADGDYAVAVRSPAGRRLLTVQPGLFGDGGLVEVSGAGLAEGQQVEVPAR